MTIVRLAAAALAVLPLAACAASGEDTAREGRIRAPAANVVGEEVSCVNTSRIRATDVYDDYTIDFEMIDRTRYRVTLPARCAGLGFEQAFSYELHGSQLCRSDMIRVMRPDHSIGASCAMGPFVPVELVEEGSEG